MVSANVAECLIKSKAKLPAVPNGGLPTTKIGLFVSIL